MLHYLFLNRWTYQILFPCSRTKSKADFSRHQITPIRVYKLIEIWIIRRHIWTLYQDDATHHFEQNFTSAKSHIHLFSVNIHFYLPSPVIPLPLLLSCTPCVVVPPTSHPQTSRTATSPITTHHLGGPLTAWRTYVGLCAWRVLGVSGYGATGPEGEKGPVPLQDIFDEERRGGKGDQIFFLERLMVNRSINVNKIEKLDGSDGG